MRHLPSAAQWYLAQVKPNGTGIAVRNLARQGFSTFLPLERETQRNTRGLITVSRPYFPGYIFIEVTVNSAPWRAIKSTQGVTRLVGFGSSPTPVPGYIVSELQQACDEEGYLTADETFVSGENVRITNGPFTNFVGQVDRLAPNQRTWVLLDVMGQATRVSVPSCNLKRAS